MSLRLSRFTSWAIAVAIAASGTGTASAQLKPVAADQTQSRSAYNVAITCYIANGNAMAMREGAGDQAKAKIYEAQAHKSYDLAFGLGKELAFPNDRIEQDIARAQSSELPLMVKDQSVFLKIVAECRYYNLM